MSQVLALKYRPSSFDKLIGQESITQTLTLALEHNRLSHAYLFSGLRGSGKTSTARIFAKSLVCNSGPTSTPCQTCENCISSNENRHIDIIEMDAASSRKIDDIRSLIEQTKYKPNSARFKIFIIDEVHMLTKEAFNALLKTLEEPPSYVKFILATTDPMKLPPTILSRTQHFRFKKINPPEVVKHLSHILNLESIEYETEALNMLTRAGNGSLRDTLTLLDQAIIYSKNFVDAKSVASMLGILDPDFIETIFSAIFEHDRDKIIDSIRELENYESEIVIDEIISFVKERFFQKDVRFSTMISDRFFRILSESKSILYLNSDSSFVLTLLFFKMVEATKIKDIDEMIDELEGKISKRVASKNIIQKSIVDEKKSNIEIPNIEESVDKDSKISKNSTDNKKRFKDLIDKLYDRNYELGECFKNSIDFIEFSNSTLKISSSADGECKELLRQSSGIIKHFTQEIFGLETKISMVPSEKKNFKNLEESSKNSNSNSKEHDNDSSCISNQVVSSKNEIDRDNLLDHLFIKKAKELFEPSKIIVKSKV